MTPHDYATAIGRALDENNLEKAQNSIREFSQNFPADFRAFLPVFQAEVLRQKTQNA